MTDQEKRALSERLATLAEAAGLPTAWVWDYQCELRHAHPLWVLEGDNGVLYCGTCYENEVGRGYSVPTTVEEASAMRDVVNAHPAWRISKQSKDLTNPTHLLPLVEAYLEHPHAAIDWEWYRVKEGWLVYFIDRVRDEDKQWKGVGATIPEAVAQALAEAMEAEKGAQ